MDVKHLISFETVARLKSYSKAADLLFLTQPAITAHISLLEKELESPLFIKYHTPMQLTDTGKLLLTHTHKILQLIKQTETEIQQFRAGLRGNLYIHATDSTANPISSFLKEFKLRHTLISLTFGVYLSNEIIEHIVDGHAQIGIIKSRSPVFSHPLLNGEFLFEDQIELVLASNHPLAKQKTITLATMQHHQVPLILFGSDSDFPQQILSHFEQAHINIDRSLNINHLPSLIVFLKNSHYITLLPKSLIKLAFDQQPFVTRKIADLPPLTRYAFMVTKKNTSFSPLLTIFKEELTNHLKGLESS